MKNFISIKDLTAIDIESIFSLTARLKKDKSKFSKVLTGKAIALIFQKPSNRTRVSFEVGMYQLGGNSIYLAPNEINLGVRESIADAAKTLSRYVDAVVLRTFEHQTVLDMAKFAAIPVINGLSDFTHPCQGLADIYTIREKYGKKKGLTLAYVGDGNNVCNSLLFASAKTGINISVGAPIGYEPDKAVLSQAQEMAKLTGASIRLSNDPYSAVQKADIIYTDVWASMGQEEESAARKHVFEKFQVNSSLLKQANRNALVMHCLPAHRGQEITDEVIDSPNSIVFDQAENRLHVQKAILIKLLKTEKL